MDGEHDQSAHKLRNVEQLVQSLKSLLAKAANDIDALATAGGNAEAAMACTGPDCVPGAVSFE